MHSHSIHSQSYAKLTRIATYASVTVAGLITIAKLIAWLMTDSLSMLSSLVDSCLDMLVSLVNMAAVHYALRPADEDHRFGHGKAEDIASFAQAAFIAGSAMFITFEAFNRLITPHQIERPTLGIMVMIYSIILTLGLLAFQFYVIKRSHSMVIRSDALHYTTDVLANIAVIISLVGTTLWNLPYLDTLIALGIAAYIFKNAWNIGIEAFNRLMDKELDTPTRDSIKALVLAHPKALGVHDLRTRYSGATLFIQFHLELQGSISLHEAHIISDEVEANVLKAFPNAEITIHEDPEGTDHGRRKKKIKD